MESPFFGELLILLLVVLNCGRIFFLKFGKVDSLTILAPVSVFLAAMQVFAWGFDSFIILVTLISVFVAIINFRAFLRFAGGLYVDHYSGWFKFGAVLGLAGALATGVLIFLNKPVIQKNLDLNIEGKRISVKGDFLSGFENAGLFEPGSGEILKFEPVKKEVNRHQAVIVVSDKRADSIEYLPLMKSLASNGYTVFAGDFYARDMKWFRNIFDSRYFRKLWMKTQYFKNPVKFEAEKEFYSYNTLREIKAMVDYVEEDFDSIYVIGDWMSTISLKEYAEQNPEKLAGYLDLTTLEEYSTPGFGLVQMTNPILVEHLGLKRKIDFTLIYKVITLVEEAFNDTESVE